MKWRLIPLIEDSGAKQMAIDEAILTARVKHLVGNTVRFYTWKPACVTIGYFQSLKMEVDVEKAEELGIDVVRRYTGGGAVFHDKELTYSVVIEDEIAGSEILESYRKICSAIVNGIQKLGIRAEMAGINDIVVNNRKISGSAQTRRQGIVLQHGTLLLDVNPELMFSLLKVPTEKIRDKLISSAKQRVTSFNSELGRQLSVEQLRLAMIKGFKQTFNIEFEVSTLTEFEKKLAAELYKKKYSNTKWTGLR